MNHTRQIFIGMQILEDQQWQANKALIVEHSKVKAIIPADMIHHHMPAEVHEFPTDYYLIPGLIDLHVHGANNHDVMDGTPASLQAISNALAKEGVTGYLATTMTASNADIEKVLQLIPQVMPAKEGAAIFGVHLEGPFIAKNKAGAQLENLTQDPNIALMQQWQSLAKNHIKIVTLAPELPGAIEFIRACRTMHVIASVGHTDATYDETEAAINAGCSQATHLYNAMRGMHQREPGAAGALLLSDKIIAELIVDGIHVHPAIVDLTWQIKGKDRLFLVSDAMRAKCMGDGQYQLGGQSVNVVKGKATLPDGTLAGSTLRLSDAIKNMVAFSHCTLAQAIQMAAQNPASVLGISDHKGSIEVGKDADLVIMDAAYQVKMTMREGAVVYQESE